MGNKASKFWLLMWKNWLLLRRRPIHSAFEIVLPVLLCLILVAIRSLIDTELRKEMIYTPQPLKAFYSTSRIAYSPDNAEILAVLDLWHKQVQNGSTYNRYEFKSFKNGAALEEKLTEDETFLAGIVFDDAFSGDFKNVDIRLRFRSDFSGGRRKEPWYTDLLYPTFQLPGPRDSYLHEGGTPDYRDRRFCEFQEGLTKALMKYQNNNSSPPDLKIRRYPYPAWNDDFFYNTAMQTVISLLIMVSFMYNFINTVRAITTEKEKQLKESMKIMGLPGWLHWLAWFLRTFIILLISNIIMVIVLKINIKVAPVFKHSDASVLLIFLIIFSCTIIAFSFLVSVFFSKANTAAAVGSLVFFLSYLPYTLQQQQYDSLSLGNILGSSILANSALAYGLTVVFNWEALEEGIQWSNLFSTVSPDQHLTFGYIILMLILDFFLYLLLALYIEAVFPGEFGVPKPWYFPFTRDFWCGEIPIIDEHSSNMEGENFEAVSSNLHAGIQIKSLSKTFGANKAVNQLNLDMYEGHITVLLGHNGAGKTTTMSMLTGMFPPSSGTAIVNNHDVRTHVSKVRDSMGLCLQHNVLFDSLTVREHLYFFGKLKGLNNEEVEREIDYYIKLLELEDKRNAMSSTLSGGMKRKVSVGMALCGKSKVVMLDEPTAGMDPSARRAIWDLLQKQKQGRTILLTTHFMDEADLLGDRIAIMSGGQLQCCGSSFFLKKRYGAGYYLIMEIAPQCEPSNVTQLLKQHIPYIEAHSRVGSELTYLLAENESHKFESMLSDLEYNITKLGVLSYGVSLTTLEEVFMKVGADHENSENNNKNGTNGVDAEIMIDKVGISKFHKNLLSGSSLLWNQFTAMFLKRSLSTSRSWLLLLIQVVIPVALMIVTILNARSNTEKVRFPELRLDLSRYQNPTATLSGIKNSQFVETYSKMVQKKNKVEYMDNIIDTMLQYTKDKPSIVKRHYILGASFEVNTITAWFNGDPYHSVGQSLSLALNALYKMTLGESSNIEFINYPLPYSLKAQANDVLVFNIMAYQLASTFGWGLAFVASFYVLFYIKERVCKSKHLQLVSGTNVWIFWGTSMLWDLITYIFSIIFVVITIAALQEDGFKTAEEIGRLFLVLIYFGFFMIPFVALSSYLFAIPSTGFSRVMLVGALSGVVGVTVIQVLEIEALDLLYIAKPLNWVLLFIPTYSLPKGVYDLGNIYSQITLCNKLINALNQTIACKENKACCDMDKDYFAMSSPGIGRNIIISFVMSCVLFLILVINEYGFFSAIMHKIFNPSKPPQAPPQIESDVLEENNKIRSMSETELKNKYILVLRDVTKYYKNFLAVNGLCLGVKPYECFGLLGVNGAGKTSTFKMMTADEHISYGEAWVQGLSVTKDQKKVQKLIGYCPQFDALLDDLTARETLLIFALIRGVPKGESKALGEQLAHEFDFFKHLDKKVKELSGGNKRKLSTALALIGDPPVIYLDEPTTGMDPATKRYLWTALSKLRDSGKCIVLTSHSMEECEALCTRIAIMVNGSFQCLGSTQRLKNKFAQGFALIIKLRKTSDNLQNEIQEIENFIQHYFPGALLKEKHQELLSYQLGDNGIPWSRMFGILESSKKQLNIEDYSLGQCSLEQVFLSFTKYQRIV